MWPCFSSRDRFGIRRNPGEWHSGSADPAEGDVCASARCSAGSFTRPAERASWTRLSPSISCWDGWAETSSTSSVPSWLISCPCRYRAGSQTPQLQGGGRGRELLYAALGARDTNCPGYAPQKCSPLPSWPRSLFSSPGVAHSLPGCSLFPPWGCSILPLLLFSLLSLLHLPSYSFLSLRGCSLLHPRTLPSSQGSRESRDHPCGAIPAPPGPRGCPQHVPSPQVYTAIYYVLADLGMLSLYCYYRVKNGGRACELGQGWGLCCPGSSEGGFQGALGGFRHSY